MTHIVNPKDYPSKKAFKEAVEKDQSKVYCYDPSIFGGAVSGNPVDILHKTGKPFTVTNHPKRSWFAEVKNGKDGKVKVI